jgi:hypothetical protein
MSIAKNLKLSFFGLLSATLMSAPAFAQNAASVTQLSGQNAAQVGVGNTAIQGNLQSADVNQHGSSYFPYSYGTGINGANVVQGNHQNVAQYGFGNTAVQGNSATANVHQSPSTTYPYPAYPSYPYPGYPTSVNGASVLQGNGQAASQFGAFNSAIQGNAADATVQQH